MKTHKIGVFDSGVGGLSVVNAIKQAEKNIQIVYADDKDHIPYGNKTAEELYGFVLPILQNLITEGCEVIVIACNTVTTLLIDRLRQEIPVPLIGMEPMVKPAAALTKSGIITVCATPATLYSARYNYLKQTYAKHVQVLEPDCSDWARLIEFDQIDRSHIQRLVTDVCVAGSDVIVLGCTHYHWIEEDMLQTARQFGTQVIQPEDAVITELQRVLAQLG